VSMRRQLRIRLPRKTGALLGAPELCIRPTGVSASISHIWSFNSVLPKSPALPLFRRSEPSHAVLLRRPNQRLLSIPRHDLWFANFDAFHTNLETPGGNRANSSANSISIGQRPHSGQHAARRRHWHWHPELHLCSRPSHSMIAAWVHGSR
jgi:hypothetical protein